VSSGSITDSTERRQQRGGAAQKTRVGVSAYRRVGVSKPVILRRPRLDPKISGTHRYILTHNGRRIVTALLAARALFQSKSPKTRANRSGECGGA
jgi:hypothetical protein